LSDGRKTTQITTTPRGVLVALQTTIIGMHDRHSLVVAGLVMLASFIQRLRIAVLFNYRKTVGNGESTAEDCFDQIHDIFLDSVKSSVQPSQDVD
jgi:hypothetical protein